MPLQLQGWQPVHLSELWNSGVPGMGTYLMRHPRTSKVTVLEVTPAGLIVGEGPDRGTLPRTFWQAAWALGLTDGYPSLNLMLASNEDEVPV